MSDETSQAPATKKPSRMTQVVSGLVTLVTLVLIFVFLFPKFGNYAEAWTYVQGMPPWSLVLLGLAVVLNVVVYVWPFMIALPGVRFGPAFVVRQTSFMISNTIPAGGAFGLAVQYGMLGSYGFGPGPTTSAIAINSLWNILATVGLPMVGALTLLVTGEMSSSAAVAGVVSLVVVVVAGVLLRIIVRSEPGARHLGRVLDHSASWCLRVLHRPKDVGITAMVLDLRKNVADVVQTRWLMLSVSNLAMQLTSWLVLFVALRGIQSESGPPYVTWSECLAAFSMARLATFIPITPGGLGTVDAALTSLLVSYGATANQALAASLVWRAGTFVPQVVLGVVTFLWWRATSSRRRARLAAAPNG
ncbi:MAG: lysylphosphatidylglycerol synthase transmembrane domain-containing protein [Actinomycetes bacterium]